MRLAPSTAAASTPNCCWIRVKTGSSEWPKVKSQRLDSSVTSIALLSCALIPWVAHTWRGLTCVRNARIHRKKHDVCATQKDLTK